MWCVCSSVTDLGAAERQLILRVHGSVNERRYLQLRSALSQLEFARWDCASEALLRHIIGTNGAERVECLIKGIYGFLLGDDAQLERAKRSHRDRVSER